MAKSNQKQLYTVINQALIEDLNCDDASASDIVYKNMKEYGMYILASKFPNCIDGLKFVQRRALYLIRDHLTPFKALLFLGMMTELHMHGDLPISGAIKRMMQSAVYGYPLITTEGNRGAYSSTEGGAPRYLDIACSQFSHDVFFNGVDMSTIPMMPSEDYSTEEPMYLIPKIPTALLFPYLTIGIGYKANTCSYALNDICDMVQLYAEYRINKRTPDEKFSIKGHEELFIPEFPTVGYLRNKDMILDQLRHGDFNSKCILDGYMEIKNNPNRLVLRTIPYGLPFYNSVTAIREAMADKQHWMSSMATSYIDLEAEEHLGEFEVNFKRGINTFEILDDFKKLTKLSAKFSPIMNFVTKNRYLKTFTPVELLQVWYRERYNSIVGGIKATQIKCVQEIRVTEGLIYISEHADAIKEVLVSGRHNRDEIVADLKEKFPQLTTFLCNKILESKLENLTKYAGDGLRDKKAKLELRVSTIMDELHNVDSTIATEAQTIGRKYAHKRRTKFDTFIGYVNVQGDGIIQYESIDELADIVNMFKNDQLSVHSYWSKTSHKYLVTDARTLKRQTTSPKEYICPPKQAKAFDIVELHDAMTCTVRISDGTIATMEDIQYPFEGDVTKDQLFYTAKDFWALSKNGHFKHYKYGDYRVRRNVDAVGVKTDVICIVPYIPEWHYVYLIHSNPSNKNTLIVDTINMRKPKPIILAPGGEETILKVLPVETSLPQFVNLPDYFQNVSGIVMFEDMKSTMNGKTRVQIDIKRNTTRHPSMPSVFLG